MKLAKWLIGLALSAVMVVLARDFVSYMGARLRWQPPPPRSGDRMGAERVMPPDAGRP